MNGRGRRLTIRSWTFDDSGVVWHDVFERRVRSPDGLAARAQKVGFRLGRVLWIKARRPATTWPQ
ncbi:hypothetical protein Kisp01_65750 [Kineosporia sp. NBRC 101677]|nr:hypothetical protein Kisp01_65750 [Kineosporia sp. NBRC 101677]